MKFLKTVLLVLLAAALGIGGTFFYMNKFSQAATVTLQAAAPVEPEIPLPIFVALQPFTVTLHDTYVNRILYTEINLRVADEASRKQITQYMPEVRNRVLTELAKHNPAAIQTTEGRNQLALDLLRELKVPYDPQPKAPAISSVLFTAFVVQ